MSHLLTNEANKLLDYLYLQKWQSQFPSADLGTGDRLQPATLESAASALRGRGWIVVPDFRFVDFTVARGVVRESPAGGAGQWRIGSRLLRAWGMGSG